LNVARELPVVAYFLGTHRDWGGASRALLNFVYKLDRTRFSPLVVISKASPLQKSLAAQGIPSEIWPTHDRGPNLFSYGLTIVKAVEFLRKCKVAVAHFNYADTGWKPAEIIAAKLLRIPIVNHLHASFAQTSSYLRYSTAIVGVSDYVCKNSDCRGVPSHVVHNVADLGRFASGKRERHKLGLREDSVVVGYIGQVRRIKGIPMFLEMAKRIAGEGVEFIIAGELRGDDTFSAEEFARMIEGDTRIRYLGRRENVEDVYASCDVVVMPSQWGEPCAMVLFEASAAGKPIVATATGGTPEILIDGETGYLVGKDDIEALVDRVARLVHDEQLRRSVGSRARDRAMNEFAERPVRQLETLYDQLLARRATQASSRTERRSTARSGHSS
jgi:glycosyltransferase involved in cell wall biosynthesis